MRMLGLAFAAGCALVLIGPGPMSAQARDFPFCIRGDGYPPLGYCAFDTYEQCQATASGRKAFCDRNYYHDFPDQSYAAPYAPSPYPSASKRRGHG